MSDKAACRRAALAVREAETDIETRSRRIGARLLARPEYAGASLVSFYVGVGREVATLDLIGTALRQGKVVAVPCTHPEDLTLHRIVDPGELAPAPFGLLEPVAAVRESAGRSVAPSDVELFVVPGLAFDPAGGRVGFGKGYYDRLLARARQGTPFIALAYRSQVFPRVPVGPGDVRMTAIVTETEIFEPGRPGN